ncbi:MAG: glycerol kinase GlpK [Candidatus Eisenbacteria bacterium]|nr:glycerol kinase GlpK [Candidatus Eisenbacteria bacterium]
MNSPLVMAIDQGTTGTTVLLINRKGAIEARGYAEIPQHYPRPGRVEHDGDEIWRSVLRAARQALSRGAFLSKRIAAVGITNQRETSILWNRKTGRPVGPAIVWQDRRTAERCAELRRAGQERFIRKSTGLVLDPYFSATKLEWMFRHQKPWRRAAARGDLVAGTIDTWLLWKLTGGAVHATDPTNASRTMLYDIHRLAWSPKLLDLFDVPDACLPEVRPSSGEFGTTMGAAPIPDGIPISGMAGDQQAALFGQGCVKPGQVKNTYGTGAFVLVHLGNKPRESRHGLLTTVACGPRGEPAWALEGSVFIAGAAVQWLRDGLGFIRNSADIETLAATVPDAGGVTVIPAFTGLGAPWWRADARGAIFGITRGTTRAHLARAVLESIAQQSADVVQVMQQDTGHRIAALRVDGGATANNLLMQFQADLLGIPIQRPRMIETTALGAGLLAGMAAGIWASPKEADSARAIDTTFKPERSSAWRRQQRDEWGRAVARLLA